jgi:RNA polymerase sigma factor (sigma-70 family)
MPKTVRAAGRRVPPLHDAFVLLHAKWLQRNSTMKTVLRLHDKLKTGTAGRTPSCGEIGTSIDSTAGAGVAYALSQIRSRYEGNANPANDLPFHNAEHTAGVIRRRGALLQALGATGPECRVGLLAAAVRDTSERDELVLRWRFLPRKIIRTLLRRQPDARRLFGFLELEDLEQVGILALLTAAERWDPARGAQFSSFAYCCILRRLRKEIRRQVHARPAATLTGEPPARAAADRHQHEDLHAALNRLGTAERELLVRRFGLHGQEPLTLISIARQCGRTPECIRQRVVRALAAVSTHLGRTG